VTEDAGNGSQNGGNTAFRGRLRKLREGLKGRGLDGFIIPRADEYQGEFIPARAERLAWLTGFTGSAGTAVVLAERAAIFVDGRYTLQVRNQVDPESYEYRHLTEAPPAEWVSRNLASGARLGFDPWLHTPNQARKLGDACAKTGAELVPCEDNPIDGIWPDRPPPPLSPMVPHPLERAGEPAAEKRRRLASGLTEAGVQAAFVAAPDSVAWLLNVRGGDVPFTPLSLAFALLHGDATVDLFVDEAKLSPESRQHFGNGVRVHAPDALGAVLDDLGQRGLAVQLDRGAAPLWVWARLEAAGAEVKHGTDPCLLPKACKNDAELEGFRASHRRDGAAVVRFLAWLEDTAAGGDLTEMAAAERLEAFRAESDLFRGASFETISGAGPNGAIVHYRCTPETDRKLEAGSLYLVDSGAQYLDGTTDITRTVAVGEPTAEMRTRFTQVLKGHIALSRAVFPQGTAGPQLDALARRPLWRDGLDYDHGTGHGVGSYLGVHEGPARIGKGVNATALKPGMVLSNEPGYYKTGEYGIRIENLIVVETRDGLGPEDKPFLGFEVLTLAPIDLSLVDAGLLTADEREWLDSYHARVRQEILPLVGGEAAAWLETATRQLK